ncbi:hypothetical protein [Geobacillus thermodenitrificans]|uniref:hypothetical protein n=1 Tax=Geobacillus thermodenitrificans TaxID=33940 RepID=UPI000B42E148|nr:hypothetical protein [Geobacillus thermodenitrificans]
MELERLDEACIQNLERFREENKEFLENKIIQSFLKDEKNQRLLLEAICNVKADDKIPNIAGIKFPTYNRTIVSMRGAMVHDYERGIFYDQRDV